jgi:hypothetical protein
MFTDEQLDVIQREYEAFRRHHAELGTVDSPAGFAARFRIWLKGTYG